MLPRTLANETRVLWQGGVSMIVRKEKAADVCLKRRYEWIVRWCCVKDDSGLLRKTAVAG